MPQLHSIETFACDTPNGIPRRYRFVSGLALILACGDATDPGSPPAFTILPAEQWSGGSVEIRSSSFQGVLPVVTAAGDTLTVARADDSTVTVNLPEASSGPIALYREGSSHDSLGVVQIFGMRNARLVPGTLGYEPLVPSGITPLVFVAESMPTAVAYPGSPIRVVTFDRLP